MLLLLASPYQGKKYVDDARMARILAELPQQRKAARATLGRKLGLEVPDFTVRIEEATGPTIHAETRLVKGKPVVFLKAEFLMLGEIHIPRTLVHEFYHCLHRTRIGEKKYAKVPVWAREGAALFVAGQTRERAELLAAIVGDERERLVDGLDGHHDLYDYFEDAAAFAAQGEKRGLALARALLDEPNVPRAVRKVTGGDVAALEKTARKYARSVLAQLGPLAADVEFETAQREHHAGKHKAALAGVRRVLAGRTTRRVDARLLELEILEALKSPEYEAALARARLDLTPFPAMPDTLR